MAYDLIFFILLLFEISWRRGGRGKSISNIKVSGLEKTLLENKADTKPTREHDTVYTCFSNVPYIRVRNKFIPLLLLSFLFLFFNSTKNIVKRY